MLPSFENAPKVTKFLKTYFDQKKAPLFVTQKYMRLKSAIS